MSEGNEGSSRRTRKVVIGLASLAMAVGAIAVGTGNANAGEPTNTKPATVQPADVQPAASPTTQPDAGQSGIKGTRCIPCTYADGQ